MKLVEGLQVHVALSVDTVPEEEVAKRTAKLVAEWLSTERVNAMNRDAALIGAAVDAYVSALLNPLRGESRAGDLSLAVERASEIVGTLFPGVNITIRNDRD